MDDQPAASAEQFEHLLANGRLTEIKAGSILADQGDGGGRCFYIAQGAVAVEVDGRRVAHISAGQIAGELAALTGEPRTATLRAVTDVVVRSLPSWDFLALLDEHPDLARTVARDASARIGELLTMKTSRMPLPITA